IDSFTLADATQRDQTRQYQLAGRNLEMIGRVGWDETRGLDVSGIPAPQPGPGLKQSLAVNLPDPPTPEAPLYVWLRGDEQGRLTTIKAPPLPAPAAPPAIDGTPASPAEGAGDSSSRQSTTTTLSPLPEQLYAGQPVTMVAKVDPVAASGTVNFLQGQISLGTATLSSGQASLTTSNLSAGSQPISAVYSGDTKYAGSSSSGGPLTVARQATTTSIVSTPNPSTANQELKLTAVVAGSPPLGTSPSGTVRFVAGDQTLGTVTLDGSGVATLRTSTLNSGKYNIRAVYSGSTVFAESRSAEIVQVVQ